MWTSSATRLIDLAGLNLLLLAGLPVLVDPVLDVQRMPHGPPASWQDAGRWQILRRAGPLAVYRGDGPAQDARQVLNVEHLGQIGKCLGVFRHRSTLNNPHGDCLLVPHFWRALAVPPMTICLPPRLAIGRARGGHKHPSPPPCGVVGQMNAAHD